MKGWNSKDLSFGDLHCFSGLSSTQANLGALRAGFYNQSDLSCFAFGLSKLMIFTDLPHVGK